jgi:hypothetical protein
VVDGRVECNTLTESANDFVAELRERSEANKSVFDKQRLDRYYKREWRVNKLLGREMLPEPCDPRADADRCEPNGGLPARPEDRIEGRGGRMFVYGTGEPLQ